MLAYPGFVAFETLFIWILGEKLYGHSLDSQAFWGMLSLAGAGHLELGCFSRSWLLGVLSFRRTSRQIQIS